jgi:hypothetical protein
MDAVDGQGAENEVIQRKDDRFGSIHGAALILLGAAVALAPAVTERFGFRGFVAVYALAALAWLPLRNRSIRFLYAIVIALVLRAFLLMPEPLLSGDVYRYLSDGRALASGTNPYSYYPSDPRINHPEIRSVYPPHAQLLFAAVHELHTWRLLIIGFDLLAIYLLRERGLAYATCPLVLFEGTWSAHIDLIAGVLLLIALTRRSGVAAGIAAGMKIIPLAAVPALFGRRIPLSFFVALILPVLFFLGGPIMPGFRDYATRWIFNSPLYDAVFAIVERVPTKAIWTHHPFRFELISDFVYRHVYPDFVTRAIMATIAVAAILLARRGSSAIAALLLCSPAIHPWYWLTLVPAAMVERTRWTLVALAAPASYLLYDKAPPIVVYVLCYALALPFENDR